MDEKPKTKKLEINMVTIKDFAAKVGKNLTWLFLIGFFLLVAFEVLEVKNSVDIALNLNEVLPAKVEKGVRINFDGYDAALKRIQDSQTFVPIGGIKRDPFSVTVEPLPEN